MNNISNIYNLTRVEMKILYMKYDRPCIFFIESGLTF
ncbi:MAG: hypothetical protein K0R54_3186 [Clostridiaceae bacterium]|jgi:hypothetical protein|nr:hypothetical protein [Clostridiaceae bacterium]